MGTAAFSLGVKPPREVKLFDPVPRSKMVQLYFHSPYLFVAILILLHKQPISRNVLNFSVSFIQSKVIMYS
jgi:hypothetical protein